MPNDTVTTMLDRLGALKDSVSASRVFGEPYVVGDTTVIPVAAVRTGGGGGAGTGERNGHRPDAEGLEAGAADVGTGAGTGAGMGFGATGHPLGVYVVRGGEVRWKPSLDVMKLALGGEVLAGLALLVLGRSLRCRRSA
jgi:uncharacterized spore protein YtfJ